MIRFKQCLSVNGHHVIWRCFLLSVEFDFIS